MNNFFFWVAFFISTNPYLNECPKTIVVNQSKEVCDIKHTGKCPLGMEIPDCLSCSRL